LVESANLSRVNERNRAKVELVQNWLIHILRRNDFPATERALAGNTLAQLGDPRREVMTIADMQFCLVPAGPFWMGDGNEKQKEPNCNLDYDFWISRYPITNTQFAEFVKAGGYQEARYWPEAKSEKFWQNGKFKGRYDNQPREHPHDFGSPFNLPNHPVVGITWYEALAFSRWLNEFCQKQNWLEAKMRVQLPSEAEWEKAARGGVEIPQRFVIASLRELSTKTLVSCQKKSQIQRRYPWGDQPETNCANYSDTGIGATSAAGCFPGGASPYGCEEMSGNVWEWTRSLYDEYPYPVDEKARTERENLAASQDKNRVLRGGAFGSEHRLVRCACRSGVDPGYWYRFIGFRLSVRPLSF
jgi:formylglycine-generating enzyme required for sulfatase activity